MTQNMNPVTDEPGYTNSRETVVRVLLKDADEVERLEFIAKASCYRAAANTLAFSASHARDTGEMVRWDGSSVEALIDQYANGAYVGQISRPPISVYVEHMREFATKLLALATPANSHAEAIGMHLQPLEAALDHCWEDGQTEAAEGYISEAKAALAALRALLDREKGNG